MNNFNIDVKNGEISINNQIIYTPRNTDLPRSLENFGFTSTTRNPDYPSHGIEVNFLGEKLSLTITTHQTAIYSAWMLWNGGAAGRKGYECTEIELISDKNSLSKKLSLALGKQPSQINYNKNIFMYDWGDISVSAAIQSMMVSIGLSWRNMDTQTGKPNQNGNPA
jgi:hypothetical protein